VAKPKARKPAPRPKAKKPAPRAKAVARPRPAPKLVLEQPLPQAPAPPPPEPAVQVVSPEELIASLPPAEPGRNSKKFILLDSNALLMQFQFSVDIENELRRILDVPYEIVVPDLVVGELRHLAGSMTGKDRGEAVMAIKLATTFKVVKTEGPADTGILRLAEKLGAIVLTNDKILRARCRAKNIPNIHLRSKAFLTVEGHIAF
jgi:rRNA-processing protein FCF1